jgi:hypothetical protein
MAFNQTIEWGGLGTLSFTVPVAGPYFIDGKMTIPSLQGGSPTASSLQVTINQNGSPVYVGLVGAQGFHVDNLLCALDDVLAFVFSSSATVDQQLNAIKATVGIGTGQ